MYYVYIVRSLSDGKFYTGMTSDLKRRIAEHCKGKSSTPSTLNRGPFTLIYSEKCATRAEARDREKYWKSGQGREERDRMLVK